MIKVIDSKDYRLLAELNEEVQNFHHEIQPKIFKPYDKEAVISFFKATLNKENTVAFLAQENEKPLGYALLFKMNFAENPFQYARTFLLLDQILVLKNYRGKGVGTLLLDAVFNFAGENNIDLVELNHWTQNDSARKFFGKSKFEYFNEKMWREVK